MSSKEIQGFTVINIRLSKDATSSHEIFAKEHSLRHQEADKPPGRTLFVLNIPPYFTEDCVKSLFVSLGKIASVLLSNRSSKGFKSGYVVFDKREGLLKALQARALNFDALPLKTGLDKWIEDYNSSIGDPTRLQKDINSFMLNYDKTEEQKKKNSKEVDDDGWTVVSKKGRRPGLARKESVKIKIQEKTTQTNKKKELRNFYTFQIKESKMKNLALLRKNYEDAKKKVCLMKNSRRFKPY